MRIWLLTVGEPLPTDGDNERLLRTGMLADYLTSRGHQVVWWTSSFNHSLKQQRVPKDTYLDLKRGYRLWQLYAPGYPKNISFRRVIHHTGIAAK